MKRLTQILRIHHTANFWAEGNNTGKQIDFSSENFLQIAPDESLNSILQNLGGKTINNPQGTHLFLPLIFENNLVNAEIVSKLPDNLIFTIQILNPALLNYAGLNLARNKFFANTTLGSLSYTLLGKNINCKPIGKSAPITLADVFNTINDYSLAALQELMEKPINLGNASIDLKIISGTSTFNIGKSSEYQQFKYFLSQNKFKIIPLAFRRNSDNSVLKSFTEILVIPENISQNTVGIISLPKSALQLVEADPANYLAINNFILHIPAIKIKLDLGLNTNAFENGAKLFLDANEIVPTVTTNAEMANFKILTTSISNYDLFVLSPKNLTIQNAQKKIGISIDPIKTLNLNTKTVKLTMTKAI